MERPSKKVPQWIECGLRRYPYNTAKHRALRYYKQLHLATPTWLSSDQRRAMRDVRHEVKRLRARGDKVVADHIVPIKGRYVCGLNVPWNLQIITERENINKSNHEWPDMPYQQVDMFPGRPPPRQKVLPL